MLSGISIVCFAASYAAALVLELARSIWSTPLRRLLAIGFVVAGWIAHTTYLALRANEAAASPLSSPYDWYLLTAWALAAVYFYLEAYYPRASVGLFVLPLMLGLIGAAQFADQQPFAQVRASRFWGNIHGASLLLGTVTVMAGFIAGVMYLVQSYRLKHKMVSLRFRLPSLEWLERINSRAILVSVLFIGIGFLSGVVLHRIEQQHDAATMSWYDPVILSLAGMLLWLVAAAAFNLLYRPARQGRKVAYLTVASFAFLMIVLGLMLFGPSQHGERRAESGERRAEQRLSAVGYRLSARWAARRQPLPAAANSPRFTIAAAPPTFRSPLSALRFPGGRA